MTLNRMDLHGYNMIPAALKRGSDVASDRLAKVCQVFGGCKYRCSIDKFGIDHHTNTRNPVPVMILGRDDLYFNSDLEEWIRMPQFYEGILLKKLIWFSGVCCKEAWSCQSLVSILFSINYI